MSNDPRDAIVDQLRRRFDNLSNQYAMLRGSLLSEETHRLFNSALSHLEGTLHAKQHDYGDTWTMVHDELGVSPILAADILVATKWSRFKNLRQVENQVADEPIQQALLDLAGYAIIDLCLRRGVNPVNNQSMALGPNPDFDPSTVREPDLHSYREAMGGRRH